MSYLMLRLDWFVVLLLVGPVGLGIYSVAFNWVEIGLYAAISIGGAVFEDSRTLDDRAARRVLALSVLLVSIIEIALILVGWRLIPALFGVEFSESTRVVLLLAPGLVAQAYSSTAWQILVARGEGIVVRSFTFRTLLIGTPVLFALTAWFGIHGAAIGSSFMYLIWAWMLSRKFSASGSQRSD